MVWKHTLVPSEDAMMMEVWSWFLAVSSVWYFALQIEVQKWKMYLDGWKLANELLQVAVLKSCTCCTYALMM